MAAARLFLSLAIASLFLISFVRPLEADLARVVLPMEGGSTWTVVAGYNTGSHYGNDPHALDLVRSDGQTSGSLVLSPISGEVSYVASDCLTINNGVGFAFLICHVWPDAGLARGVQVTQGQAIATVAPPGYAGNNGLAHVHFALHRTLGAGQIQETIPFAGQYALEGHELTSDGSYNQWFGARLTSSNPGSRLDASSARTGREALPPAHEVWRLVGVSDPLSVADLDRVGAGSAQMVLGFDAGTQLFERFGPGLPATLNTFAGAERGAALWIRIDPGQPFAWSQPADDAGGVLTLGRGFNLVTWLGPPRPVAEAIQGIQTAVRAVFAWDAEAGRYRVYRPAGPVFLNELSALLPGQGLWILMGARTEWVQG